MNRRQFLERTVGVAVLAPVLSSAKVLARDSNAGFSIPEAPGLTDYLIRNSMGEKLRVESMVLNDVEKAYTGDSAYFRVFLGETDLGTVTTYSDCRKPFFLGILPFRGKLNNTLALGDPSTGKVYRDGDYLLDI